MDAILIVQIPSSNSPTVHLLIYPRSYTGNTPLPLPGSINHSCIYHIDITREDEFLQSIPSSLAAKEPIDPREWQSLYREDREAFILLTEMMGTGRIERVIDWDPIRLIL